MKNLATKDVTDDGWGFSNLDLDDFNKFVYDGLDVVKNKVVGTALNDDVDVSDYKVTDKKNKGVTITTGQGNDTIVGTSGNDTITTGTGFDAVNVDLADFAVAGTFGNDVINLTKNGGVTITVSDTDNGFDNEQMETYVKGNDVVVDAYAKATIDFDRVNSIAYAADAATKVYTKVEVSGETGSIIDLKVVSEGDPAQTKVYAWSETDFTEDVTATYGDYVNDPSTTTPYQRLFVVGTGDDATYTVVDDIAEAASATYHTLTADKTVEITATSVYGDDDWNLTDVDYEITDEDVEEDVTVTATLGGHDVEALFDDETYVPTDADVNYYLKTTSVSEYLPEAEYPNVWGEAQDSYEAVTEKGKDATTTPFYEKLVTNEVTGVETVLNLGTEAPIEEVLA